ncbi:MAG: outer membrane beta-barrel protein [Marinomonas foliarum]|uniref:outer membrane beta-barrel protein n=1 Tax=Marinomonas foliarum TaxID=491950 RepID=UPI003F9DC540
MNKTLLASALLLTTISAHAVDAPQWAQLSFSGVSADVDDVDMSGLAFAGSKLLSDNVFIFGRLELTDGYIDISGQDYLAELSRFSAGAGYRSAITDSTDLFGKLSFERYTAKVSVKSSGVIISAEDTTTGLGLEFGGRSMVTENVELGASVSLINMNSDDDDDGSETGINAFAAYHFNEKYSLALNHSSIDDASISELRGTMSF